MSLEDQLCLHRTTSSRKILPSSSSTSSSFSSSSSSTTSSSNTTTRTNLESKTPQEKPMFRKFSITPLFKFKKTSTTTAATTVPTILRSLLSLLPLPALIFPTCRWLHMPATSSSSASLGRRVTGTLFGPKRGHVTFAVQDDLRSEPVLLLELATPTFSLVKEMSSGLVRIALECERRSDGRSSAVKLFQEPMWTMYCNGRKTGYAVARGSGDSHWHALRTVQSVSIGAGVLPPPAPDGDELMYMRAHFERVVGSRDSEAFYMLNPDGRGGPDLSIFLLRI